MTVWVLAYKRAMAVQKAVLVTRWVVGDMVFIQTHVAKF